MYIHRTRALLIGAIIQNLSESVTNAITTGNTNARKQVYTITNTGLINKS